MTYKAFNYIERKKWAKREALKREIRGIFVGILVTMALIGLFGLAGRADVRTYQGLYEGN